jgi:hypothetical protein
MNDKQLYGFEFNYSFEELPNGLLKFDAERENNCYLAKYLARSADFDIVSNALEESTFINHITGKPFIRTSVLYRQILLNAIVRIDFPDNDKLNSIEINSNVINSMNYNLAKLICKNWLRGVL